MLLAGTLPQPCSSKVQKLPSNRNHPPDLPSPGTLGERIKKWRLEQGLFERNLAKIIGVSEMTIVNWERGRPDRKNSERLETILRDPKD